MEFYVNLFDYMPVSGICKWDTSPYFHRWSFFHCLPLFFYVFSLLLTMNTSLFAECRLLEQFCGSFPFLFVTFTLILYMAASLASFRIEVSFKSFPAALIVTHKYDTHRRNLTTTKAAKKNVKTRGQNVKIMAKI